MPYVPRDVSPAEVLSYRAAVPIDGITDHGTTNVSEQFVVKDDTGTIVALGWVMWEFMDGAALLNRVFVPRHHRGTGYGRALLANICATADMLNVDMLLSVEPDDENDGPWIRDWYSRAGFLEVPELGPSVMRRTPHQHPNNPPADQTTRPQPDDFSRAKPLGLDSWLPTYGRGFTLRSNDTPDT